MPKHRRENLESPVTPTEKKSLRSMQQKLAWLARNTRPEFCFEVGRLQQRIEVATVQDILDTNKATEAAKKDPDRFIKISPLVWEEVGIVAISDSAFMNAGEGSSQAGFVIVASGPELLSDGIGPISVLSWRSHRLKRKVRSTLAAETMAMSEATESGDLLRAYLAEARAPGFVLRQWQEHVKEVRLTAVTDCKSLYDHLSKQGSAPADDRRLQLDIQILRDMIENTNMTIRWVATQQMIADGLTKNIPNRYLSSVIRSGVLHLVKHPDIEWVFEEEKVRDREKKKKYVLEHRALKKAKVQKTEESVEAESSNTWMATVATATASAWVAWAVSKACDNDGVEEIGEVIPGVPAWPTTTTMTPTTDTTPTTTTPMADTTPTAPTATLAVPTAMPVSTAACATSSRAERPAQPQVMAKAVCKPTRQPPVVQWDFPEDGPWEADRFGNASCPHPGYSGPWRNQYGLFIHCVGCKARWRACGD